MHGIQTLLGSQSQVLGSKSMENLGLELLEKGLSAKHAWLPVKKP